jgi:tetratricopeptide (TPR) repeat protein
MSPARFILLFAIGGALLCGCDPAPQSQADEQKEPHFLEGRSRVTTMDYRGAIESFGEALEVNPRSASAHFELGCLYDQKDPDAAAAIYHYGRYLKLRPDAPNAETIRQRIQGLKQELAETDAALPPSTFQREIERLMEENRKLREEVVALQASRDAWTNLPATQPIRTQPPSPAGSGQQAAFAGNNSQSRHTPVTPATSRKHTVQSGESFASIARRYGVKMEALQAANPNAHPKRLQIGQSVNLPSL